MRSRITRTRVTNSATRTLQGLLLRNTIQSMNMNLIHRPLTRTNDRRPFHSNNTRHRNVALSRETKDILSATHRIYFQIAQHRTTPLARELGIFNHVMSNGEGHEVRRQERITQVRRRAVAMKMEHVIQVMPRGFNVRRHRRINTTRNSTKVSQFNFFSRNNQRGTSVIHCAH